MGVVYRARDTRLGRTVALKFLSLELPPDPRARSRFLDEARAAAALDHPNICTLYEAGETPEGQLYLVMAYYAGESLRDRLARGPLAQPEALDIAMQVARGLAQAHRRGIVHRDIKPANLMLTADGVVKVVDFGIARLPGQVGCCLPGTPAYMSPQQTRGEQVDARSDLWSLGVVLHEMLTGCRPGHDTSGLRSAESPATGAEWAAGPRRDPAAGPALHPAAGTLPPGVAAVLSRLLAPDPSRRYPDAPALLADLAALAGAAGAGAHGTARGAPWRLGMMAVAAAAAALAIACGAYLLAGHDRPPWSMRYDRVRLTDLQGRESFPALAPDGASFVYTRLVGDRNHLFLQQLAGGAPVDLSAASPADDTQAAFSPDGRRLAFRSERDGGGIYLMDPPGGAARRGTVRRLTGFGFNPSWSPDGREILCATEGILSPRTRRHPSQVFRVEVATGRRRLILDQDAVQPSWSPGGGRIAYWRIATDGRRSLWTASSDGQDRRRLTDGRSVDWNPVWSPDGRYLYFVSDRGGVMDLWRMRIDERSGTALGEPEPVTTSTQAAAQPSIAADGRRIAYAAYESRSFLESAAFDPVRGTAAGGLATISRTASGIHACDASPDGRWLVFQTTVPEEDLFLVHPDGSGTRLLAAGGFHNRLPRWSPDSSRVAFYSNRGGGTSEIWIARADGGPAEPASAWNDPQLAHPVWSPDGRRLAVDLGADEALLDLEQPLAARRPAPLPAAGGGLHFSASSWSADRRWLAGGLHHADGTRLPGIVLYDLATSRYRRLTTRGECPLWLADSRRLLYIDGRHIELADAATGRTARALTAPPGAAFEDLALSADNRTLYLVRVADEGDIWMVTLR